jgi:coenzyme F420 hydrogenase subunit beta
MDYSGLEPEPKLFGKCTDCGVCYDACPGRDAPMLEMDEFVFGRRRDLEKEDALGIYRFCVKGHATDAAVRDASASGGLTTAICAYALDKGIVDGVILAGFSHEQPWRCVPYIATSSEDFKKLKTNSALVIVPVNELLIEAVVRRKLKKIGIVGLPCHIHGIRKMQMNDTPHNVSAAINFTISNFCASAYYLEGTRHLVMEFAPIKGLDDVAELNYRGGPYPGALTARSKDGKTYIVAGKHDYTWHFLGPASYKRDRCLMCPDFVGEHADLCVGDSFTQKAEDPRWTVALVKTGKGEQLIQNAVREGYLHTEEYDPALVPASGLGWESKKHASVYRTKERKRFGWPTPNFGYVQSHEPLQRKLYFPK